jgi:hypothetical protein
MDTNINAMLARQQIAERTALPRNLPRQRRRRTTLADKLRRVSSRVDN